MIYRKATLSSFHKSWKVVASCGERRLIAFLFSGSVCSLGLWIMMLNYLLGTRSAAEGDKARECAWKPLLLQREAEVATKLRFLLLQEESW